MAVQAVKGLGVEASGIMVGYGDVGMPQLDGWDRGFLSRWGYGCWSLVVVVCCLGSGFCDELIPSSGEYHVCVCVCVSV